MFVYTVYGTPNVPRSTVRRVESAAAVEPVRATTPSWRAQYGNAGQPQQTYASQQAYRAGIARTPALTAGDAGMPSTTAPQTQKAPDNNALTIFNALPAVLEQRQARPRAGDGQYIRRYTEQLTELKTRRYRQRQAELNRAQMASSAHPNPADLDV